MQKHFLLVAVTLICSLKVTAATITVNTLDLTVVDDDGLCNFYEAMDAVNTNTASGILPGECAAGDAMPVIDVIEFDPQILPAHFHPFVPFELDESVHINGVSKDLVKFTSQGTGRSFTTSARASASYRINDVTFVDNSVSPPLGNYGGAMWISLSSNSDFTLERVHFLNNFTAQSGGAIAFLGASLDSTNTVEIKDCLFDGNFVSNFETDVFGGGAIFIGAGFNITITNSAFINNQAFNLDSMQPLSDAAGGALLVRSPQTQVATVDIFNSTFSNNSATGVGGAIALGGPGFPSEYSAVSVRHSTVVNNTADSNSDQTTDHGGGGIWAGTFTPLKLFNSVVALNTDNSTNFERDISGSFETFGYNFISDNTGNTTTFPVGQPNANDDWVGTTFALLDPGIEDLADNGGPTPSHMPLSDSLLLDQGKCNAQTSDQRLFNNSISGMREEDIDTVSNALTGCDIGAIEYQTTSSNFIPVAIIDGYDLFEGETLNVSALEGLLANDTDTEPLIVNSVGPVVATNGLYDGTANVQLDGSFDFQTDNPDANGQLIFEYTITDQYNTDTTSVVLNVWPVNDPPTFTPGTNGFGVEAGEEVNRMSWASEMSAGPTNDETTQTLNFVTAVSEPAFFSVLPTVDEVSGDLHFVVSPSAQATGSIQIDVTLQDSGGTDNGGMDSSETVSVFIGISDLIFKNDFEPQGIN